MVGGIGSVSGTMSETRVSQYSRRVAASGQEWFEETKLRRLVPVLALVIALVAATVDPASAIDLALAAAPVVAFGLWAYTRRVPLAAAAFGVIVPVVVAQRSGGLELLMFEAVLLAFVVALVTAAGGGRPSAC